MKKSLFAAVFAVLSAAGCNSYLDRQPDEPYTSKNVFESYNSTFRYLVNVYSWITNETDPSGQANHYTPSSDECVCVFTGRPFAQWNNSTWSVSTEDQTGLSYYTTYYKGIREASYFIANVGRCPELSPAEALEWAAEARFLRAYYYFCLMRLYGPVVLLGEGVADFNDLALRERDRNPWDECVDWVAEECRKAAADLPLTQPDSYLGRATKGVALALRARLLLYAARPLFNGNPMYRNMTNAEGKYLFPQSYDASKWTKAAEAARDVLDLRQYELIETGNPYVDWRAVFTQKWNRELIFGYQKTSYNWRVATIPLGVGGRAYGGVAITQKLVDAFAMDTEHGGRYPITGYQADGSPVIDPQSGYDESGFTSFTHPILGSTKSTYNMYLNREPRFYMSVFYEGLNWIGGSNTVSSIQFYYGGNSGQTSSNFNYPLTGYLPFKFQDTGFDSKNAGSAQANWTAITWPLFRYAEVLLNYAEALNRQPERDATAALAAINAVRKRAAIYPEVEADADALEAMIRRERMIELNFENHRFFDTRMWLIAEQENAGAFYGMNIQATDDRPDGDFWHRTVVAADGGNTPSTRIFNKRNYLLPIPQSEIDRLYNVTQNYQW